MAYQKVAQRCNDASDPSRFVSIFTSDHPLVGRWEWVLHVQTMLLCGEASWSLEKAKEHYWLCRIVLEYPAFEHRASPASESRWPRREVESQPRQAFGSRGLRSPVKSLVDPRQIVAVLGLHHWQRSLTLVFDKTVFSGLVLIQKLGVSLLYRSLGSECSFCQILLFLWQSPLALVC